MLCLPVSRCVTYTLESLNKGPFGRSIKHSFHIDEKLSFNRPRWLY